MGACPREPLHDMHDKPADYWKEKLSPEEYSVLREGGTEPAFSGAYFDNKEDGMYRCRACGALLFSSNQKFDSGTGWPSFFKPEDNEALELRTDTSHGMRRTEVLCRNCGSHLGHVFSDAPRVHKGEETEGNRFCINSCALDFKAK